jgi:hypothetical protein
MVHSAWKLVKAWYRSMLPREVLGAKITVRDVMPFNQTRAVDVVGRPVALGVGAA